MGLFKEQAILDQQECVRACESTRKVATGRLDAVHVVDGEETAGTEWVCLDCGCVWIE